MFILGGRSARIPRRSANVIYLVINGVLFADAASAWAQDPGDLCRDVWCARLDDCHDRGVCDPATGLCSNPPVIGGLPCTDSDTRTYNDVCVNGLCVGTVDLCFAIACHSLDDCHAAGQCDPQTGECPNPIRPDGTHCNDSDTRTYDDVCVNGVCVGTVDLCFSIACRSLDDCHAVGQCDAATGECPNPKRPDGTPCNDSNAMTIDDVCIDGVCGGLYTLCGGVRCVPPDDCHDSVCEHATGNCIVTPVADGAGCNDGDPNTFQDACYAGVCAGDADLCADVMCIPLDDCHRSVCDPATGRCVELNRPNSTVCDDGWNGTAPDECWDGVCVGESLYEFSGFRPPLENLPAFNVAQAGARVVVKFSLGGNMGLDVFVDGEPKSAAIRCRSADSVDDGEPTLSPKGGLRYDPREDQYSYHWDTEQAWNGTCRQLVIQLDDGSYHRANFSFRDQPPRSRTANR